MKQLCLILKARPPSFIAAGCSGLIVMALNTLLINVAWAQVYKWTDPDTGKVIMSNAPPPGKIKGQLVQKAPSSEKDKNGLTASEVKEGGGEEKKPVNDKNAVLCASTRQNIAVLETTQPVIIDGKDIDDATRAAELGRAKDILRLFCK